MAFLDAFNKRKRQPWDERLPDGRSVYEAIQGQQPDQTQMPQQPQQQVPPDQQTRPRVVNPFVDRLMQGQTRPRIADPTTFDAEHLREIESQPLGLRGKAGLVAQNLAINLGYHPLQTRRQRDVGDVEGRLGRDIAIQSEQNKRQALKSQIDAREAAILAGQERIRQGDERLGQQQDALRQRETQDYHNNLIREYNGQTDFDPEDPKNADFVAEWQRAFGRKPMRNVRGSQMAVIQGYRPDGTPIVSVVNKGTRTAEEVKGAVPTTTEGQQNRAAAMARTHYSQAQQNQRAGMRQGGAGGMTLPQKVAAEKLVARYNFVRKQEMDLKTPAEQKRLLTKQREALGNQIYATYPGMFEEAEGGEIRAKAQGAPATSGITEQQIRDAAKARGLDPDTAVERARKRGLIQ